MSDPRFDLALYSVPEAARLARIPRQTLLNWVKGYAYPVKGAGRRARPVVDLTVGGPEHALSFVNLVEVVALSGFRQGGVSMQRVRKALEYVGHELQQPHPFASSRVLTDGMDLFWRYQEHRDPGIHLVNVGRGGQRAFPEAVMQYLREIEWGRDSFATRWWPGSARAGEGPIVIDPRRAFGAPVLAGTAIRTEDVFDRISAGESLGELAEDYGLSREAVEAAIRAEARFLEPLAA